MSRVLSFKSEKFFNSRFLSKHCFCCIIICLLSVLSCSNNSQAENYASNRMRIHNARRQSNSNERVIETLDSQERRRAADSTLTSTLNNAQGLYNNVTGTLNSAHQLYNNATSIYNKTKSTIDGTVSTPPSQWTKNQWIYVGIALAVVLCCFGCIWRCIPCAPRIIWRRKKKKSIFF
jgi:cobalamin biosynthesis Mg chelatase CobN